MTFTAGPSSAFFTGPVRDRARRISCGEESVMAIEGRRPVFETYVTPKRVMTHVRERERASAATRRRADEAALAAAVRELRTRRRPAIRDH